MNAMQYGLDRQSCQRPLVDTQPSGTSGVACPAVFAGRTAIPCREFSRHVSGDTAVGSENETQSWSGMLMGTQHRAPAKIQS
jgi:hypothetical protein